MCCVLCAAGGLGLEMLTALLRHCRHSVAQLPDVPCHALGGGPGFKCPYLCVHATNVDVQVALSVQSS
jgi:hypothetical protein